MVRFRESAFISFTLVRGTKEDFPTVRREGGRKRRRKRGKKERVEGGREGGRERGKKRREKKREREHMKKYGLLTHSPQYTQLAFLCGPGPPA